MFATGFIIDSAIQIAVNRGFDNYDWKQATQTGLSVTIGGGITGGLLKAGTASLGKRMAVNALVSGVVDGGLQLTRNKLEGKCDVFEGVGRQAITGAIGGAGGELAEAGLKSAWKGAKNFFKNNTDEIAEGVAKNGAKNADAADVFAKRVKECFVAGTLIATPIGFVPIEEIKVGDKVYGGTKEYPGGIFRVRQLFQRQVEKVLDVVVDGVKITCTPEHPFWVEGYGWVLAKDLEPGYWLLTKEGVNLPVDSITCRESVETVYNFEMDEYHTYYVSKLAILSHNICVYTTTDFPVDLNRPAPGGNLDPVDYPGGTYVTRENITDPRTLFNHIRNNVPRSSARGSRFYPEYITQIDVPETALMPDIPGGPSREGITAWIPPNTEGAKITKVWRVTEEIDPEWRVQVPVLEPIVDETL